MRIFRTRNCALEEIKIKKELTLFIWKEHSSQKVAMISKNIERYLSHYEYCLTFQNTEEGFKWKSPFTHFTTSRSRMREVVVFYFLTG